MNGLSTVVIRKEIPMICEIQYTRLGRDFDNQYTIVSLGTVFTNGVKIGGDATQALYAMTSADDLNG